ncbi:hypothetical protein Tco_1514448 [Tanacetum coccineum]
MPISARMTASVPYVSENGVSPLLDLIMVRCTHKTCESSPIQSLLLSSNRALMPSPRLLFALSTKPFACGYVPRNQEKLIVYREFGEIIMALASSYGGPSRKIGTQRLRKFHEDSYAISGLPSAASGHTTTSEHMGSMESITSAINQTVEGESQASKIYAEQKEEEVKILENFVEELDSTINLLEKRVNKMEEEIERHHRIRDSLEVELQSVSQRYLELQEAHVRIKDLEDEMAEQANEFVHMILAQDEVTASQSQHGLSFQNLDSDPVVVRTDISTVYLYKGCTMWNRKFPIPLHSCSTGRGTGAMKVFKTGEAHLTCTFVKLGIEQLHKKFKLCGSPSEDYWKRSRLPDATLFKPQQPYKRCTLETFKDFPPSSLPLLDCLISIDPDDCGSATASLNSAMRLKLDIAYVYMVSIFSVSFILCCDAL